MASLEPHSETWPRVLVLACGNVLRGDDAAGWKIGCAVKRQRRMAGLTVLLTTQLLPEHAEAVSNADIVAFVDCSAVVPAGAVTTDRILPAESLPRIFTHHLDPASLLRLALDLYGHAPRQAIAITVGGESFGVTSRLSEAVHAALPHAIEVVYSGLYAVRSIGTDLSLPNDH